MLRPTALTGEPFSIITATGGLYSHDHFIFIFYDHRTFAIIVSAQLYCHLYCQPRNIDGAFLKQRQN